ncbi:LysR family transcriptional regulator [Novosphingobium sp.]|uniref:LysR family transcriptional regulator n=1 Tax=Novosphingobium sp. TaxID=1874826 RepID=UPI002602E387|nr:LysR family transcriptional regulator [Novosphingobium sp.]
MPLDPDAFGDVIAIRDAGTLSTAAKARGVAVSTVSRRIEALEAALGLQLVDRRTNGVRLTNAGIAIAEAASPITEQMRRVERVAESLRQGSKTVPIRISATEFVISDVLAPALDQLWRMGADFPVHLQSQGDVVSLAGRDADLAIRMVRPEGASLYARRIADIRLGLFASADYVAGREPVAIDLKAERLLVYDDSYGRLPELDWVKRYGLSDAVFMRTGSTRGLLSSALAGAGIALLPAPFALRTGTLIEIPPPSRLPSRQPWLIVHRDLRGLPAIKLAQKWVIQTFENLA